MPKTTTPTTIEGTVFLCNQCAETGYTTRFRAGSRGLEPLFERVKTHYEATGHLLFIPLNPKKGMLCQTPQGKVIPRAYRGAEVETVEEWWETIKPMGAAQPVWELEQGDETG